MDKNILKIRIVLWLALAIIIAWFGYMKIVPSGKIGYSISDFGQPNYFIGKLSPVERVELSKDKAVIKGDPVYFSLRPPRRFESAKVTVKYKNTTNLPVLEIGLLNDKVAWGYDLKPLNNKIIDQLSLVWPVVYGSDGSRLIEREKKYDTVESFLKNLLENRLPADEVALYDYSLKNKFLLAGYAPKTESRTIDCGWRGSYQFYTYVKNENLNFLFNFIDLNLNRDSDAVDIKVYSPAGLIYAKHIDDDGASGLERQIGFKMPNLPEGVYRLSFAASDDIITKSIVTTQSRFALVNKVWLASGAGENKILYTDSRQIGAQTINPASLGKIKIGGEILNLNQTYKQFFLKVSGREKNLTKVEPAKDDIIISGDGVFSFSAGEFLEPRFQNLDGNIDVNRDKINYILTNYRSPEDSAGWQTAAAEFDLTKAYQENGKYQFLISLPGLASENQIGGEAMIKEIKVELQGTGLWQKIKKYFNR